MEGETGAVEQRIAIVGMAGRFPGAADITSFWQNIRAGRCTIATFSAEELRQEGVSDELLRDADYVRAKGYLEGSDCFDAEFFGVSPREAQLTDPQHRLFLECCWSALEDAGCDPATYSGRIGVYGGSRMNTYAFDLFARSTEQDLLNDVSFLIGNDKDYLTTRVSHKLGLNGTSVSVQSACSTSLVAVSLAAQSLLSYENDMALAGGVRVSTPLKSGYLYREGGIESPDGACRSFDAEASGTVFGDGVGVVVLKRLADAIRDGDQIHAVILGHAVNNDGAARAAFTAPSVSGQEEVIVEALASAGIDAQTIGFVECHGTGTQLGDPIELRALQMAFDKFTQKRQYCAIGSSKPNIGHLSAAAGIAGLIKAVCALKAGELPPCANFKTPTPHFDFERSAFFVNQDLRAWPRNDFPRRAAVSSFGLGGTNAHVVLEAPPDRVSDTTTPEAGGPAVLPISARSEEALVAQLDRLRHALENLDGQASVHDVARTLQRGRRSFAVRDYVVADDIDGARQAFGMLSARTRSACGTPPEVVFLFPGQGSQYRGMGASMYLSHKGFRHFFDRCASGFLEHTDLDLVALLQPDPPLGSSARDIFDTDVAQPLLFSLEYALAKVWIAAGVRPASMIGHSLGEITAAAIAGVMSLDDAIRVVATRGRLMQHTEAGGMLAVFRPSDEVRQLLSADVGIGAVNEIASTIVSGRRAAIDDFAKALDNQDIAYKALDTRFGFHSCTMESIGSDLEKAFRSLSLRGPTVRFISGVTGDWIDDKSATDPTYWFRQAREPVLFHAGLTRALSQPGQLLIEVGPGETLSRIAARAGRNETLVRALPTLSEGIDEQRSLAAAAGAAWAAGVALEWTSLLGERDTRQVSLPTYPFRRTRHWIAAARRLRMPIAPDDTGIAPATPDAGASTNTDSPVGAERLIKRPDVSSWLYRPSWQRFELPPAGADRRAPCTWLVFAGNGARTDPLIAQLRASGQVVFAVHPGERLELSERGGRIRPDIPGDYDALVDHLQRTQALPTVVLHLWCCDTRATVPDPAAIRESVSLGHNSLLLLLQSLALHLESERLEIVTVTTDAFAADDRSERVDPFGCALYAIALVAPLEYGNVSGWHVDLGTSKAGDIATEDLHAFGALLLARLDRSGSVLAVRNGEPLRREFSPIDVVPASRKTALGSGGVYLITGGFGGLGRAIAEHVSAVPNTSLALVTRTVLPDTSDWDQVLGSAQTPAETRDKILFVRTLEAQGARVQVLNADISREEEVRRLTAAVQTSLGPVTGIFHTAGVPSGSMIEASDPQDVLSVFASKVMGIVHLSQAIDFTTLEFVTLFSSLNGVLGRAGQTAYCAANAFLDGFAHYRCQRGDRCTVSVDWDVWAETGMAVQTQVPAELQAWRQESLRWGMTNHEGLAALEAALATGQPQVIVSTRDFPQVVAQHRASGDRRFSLALRSLSASKPRSLEDARPPAHAVQDADHGLAGELARIWGDVLGVPDVQASDNFIALGGHSLTATILISRLRKELGLKITLRKFLEQPTIAAILDSAESPRPAGGSLPGTLGSSNAPAPKAASAQADPLRPERPTRSLDFRLSLFFFSASGAAEQPNKYELLLDAARFADDMGYEAVWVPERHFNAFGGLYPNPAVTAAALATATTRIAIRAGSVILPLHDPLRVAEEWAAVDSLSNGRIALAFGSGWHVNDFALAPTAYAERKDMMFRHIELIKSLWSGAEVSMKNGVGMPVRLRTFPRPLQTQLPIWLTAESSATFEQAGRMGANVLTALLHQDLDTLGSNIQRYHAALRKNGLNPDLHTVTLMLHTFVSDEPSVIDAVAKRDYLAYLETNMRLQRENAIGLGLPKSDAQLHDSDLRDLAEVTFEKKIRGTSLIGSSTHCREVLTKLAKVGVNEFACLIDFVAEPSHAMASLRLLTDAASTAAAHRS